MLVILKADLLYVVSEVTYRDERGLLLTFSNFPTWQSRSGYLCLEVKSVGGMEYILNLSHNTVGEYRLWVWDTTIGH